MMGKFLPLLVIMGLVMGIGIYAGFIFSDRPLSPEEKILKNATVKNYIAEYGFNGIGKLESFEKLEPLPPCSCYIVRTNDRDLSVIYSEEKDEIWYITNRNLPDWPPGISFKRDRDPSPFYPQTPPVY